VSLGHWAIVKSCSYTTWLLCRHSVHPRLSTHHFRHYGSETALQQHLRDTPVHARECESPAGAAATPPRYRKIDRRSHSPGTAHALVNPVGAVVTPLRYRKIDRSRHSQRTQQDTETPLDVFFRSFPMFEYDPSLPPATSYANLRRHKGWRRGSAASDDAWNKYQDALQSELHMWYGAEDDLTACHALCRAIGVKPLPKTCEQCEEVGDRATKIRQIHADAGHRLYEGHTSISSI
jgi:hypothetical protein